MTTRLFNYLVELNNNNNKLKKYLLLKKLKWLNNRQLNKRKLRGGLSCIGICKGRRKRLNCKVLSMKEKVMFKNWRKNLWRWQNPSTTMCPVPTTRKKTNKSKLKLKFTSLKEKKWVIYTGKTKLITKISTKLLR